MSETVANSLIFVTNDMPGTCYAPSPVSFNFPAHERNPEASVAATLESAVAARARYLLALAHERRCQEAFDTLATERTAEDLARAHFATREVEEAAKGAENEWRRVAGLSCVVVDVKRYSWDSAVGGSLKAWDGKTR